MKATITDNKRRNADNKPAIVAQIAFLERELIRINITLKDLRAALAALSEESK